MYLRLLGCQVDDSGISFVLYWRAVVAFEKGDLHLAEVLFQKSFEMDRRIHGKNVDHPDIPPTLYRQGNLALAKGQYEAAEKRYHDSLSMSRRLHGSDPDEWISIALYGLARVALERGELDEAEKRCRESLDESYLVHGSDAKNPNIADSFRVLAAVQFKRGRPCDAADEMKRALQMYRTVYKSNESHRRIVAANRDLEEWKLELH